MNCDESPARRIVPGTETAGSIGRVGFACVTHNLGLSTSHTFRLANLGEGRLADTVSRNLDDLDAILEWMAKRDLRLFRIGSSLVPFASHEKMTFDWQSLFLPRLRATGEKFSALGFRFSMHPGQYNVLNSPSPKVVERTVSELVYSCAVLDLMGLDASSKVVVHGGGVYRNKAESLRRLEKTIVELPPAVRRRLAIENDERHFSFQDILEVSLRTGAPAVFDHHHHRLNPSPEIVKLLESALQVWGGTPEIHLSSQKPGARPGAHDLMIHECDLDDLLGTLSFRADLMVEAKAKEAAAAEVLDLLRDKGKLAEREGG